MDEWVGRIRLRRLFQRRRRAYPIVVLHQHDSIMQQVVRVFGFDRQRALQMSLGSGFVIVLNNIDDTEHEFRLVVLVI